VEVGAGDAGDVPPTVDPALDPVPEPDGDDPLVPCAVVAGVEFDDETGITWF